jgi:hypothetical protein
MRAAKVEQGRGGTEDQLVIYPRRWKPALFTCGALVFVLAGIAIGLGSDWRASPGVVVASYMGVPFFGFCFLYLVSRLVARKPAVIVSEVGILDNATALGAGMIRWDEVRDVRVTPFGTERMLVIVPKDEAALLARQHPIKRLFMRMNKSLANAIVCIPQNILPMMCEELRDEIRRYRKMRRSRGRNQP